MLSTSTALVRVSSKYSSVMRSKRLQKAAAPADIAAAEPVAKKAKGKASKQEAELATPKTEVKEEEEKPDVNALSETVSPKDHSEFYLIKCEPSDYSIDDLEKEKQQTTCWEGVRNARARNIMRAMRTGQKAFMYQSACKVPGVTGVVEIVKEAYPDDEQFDPKSKYYDSKATQDNPKWSMVDIKFERKLSRVITLEELKKHKDGALKGMQLFTTARLSVQNVTQSEWDFVLSLQETDSC
eukprot:jgi/Ulvmu1/2779/UM140_0009.1